MNMLAMTLQSLGSDPFAWAAAATILLLAFAALWRYRTCPYLAGEARGDVAEARAFLNSRIAQGPGYLAAMVAGIATLVAGLSMVAEDMYPEIGFFILVLGVVVVQALPILIRVQIATARVVAAEDDEDGLGAARADLQDMHRSLVISLFVLATCVALALLAF